MSVLTALGKQLVFGGRRCGKTLEISESTAIDEREWKRLPCLPLQKMDVKCGCGLVHHGIAEYQAHKCLTDAEIELSLRLESIFDRQQKRAVALFNGGL